MVGTFFLSVSFSDERELLDFLSEFPFDRRILKLRVFFPLSSWRSIYSIYGASLTPNDWWMTFDMPQDEESLVSFLNELKQLKPFGYSLNINDFLENYEDLEKLLEEFRFVQEIRRLEKTIEQEGV